MIQRPLAVHKHPMTGKHVLVPLDRSVSFTPGNRTTALDQPTPELARSTEIRLLTMQSHTVAGTVTKPTPETSSHQTSLGTESSGTGYVN